MADQGGGERGRAAVRPDGGARPRAGVRPGAAGRGAVAAGVARAAAGRRGAAETSCCGRGSRAPTACWPSRRRGVEGEVVVGERRRRRSSTVARRCGSRTSRCGGRTRTATPALHDVRPAGRRRRGRRRADGVPDARRRRGARAWSTASTCSRAASCGRRSRRARCARRWSCCATPGSTWCGSRGSGSTRTSRSTTCATSWGCWSGRTSCSPTWTTRSRTRRSASRLSAKRARCWRGSAGGRRWRCCAAAREIEQQAAMFGVDPALARGELLEELLPGCAREAGVGDVPYVPNAPSGGAMPFHPREGVANWFGVGGYRRPLSDVRTAGVRFASECLAFANVPDDVEDHDVGVMRDVGADWDFADVRDHYLRELWGVERSHPRYWELARQVTGELMAYVFGDWRRAGSGCGGGLILWSRDLRPGSGWGVLDVDGRREGRAAPAGAGAAAARGVDHRRGAQRARRARRQRRGRSRCARCWTSRSWRGGAQVAGGWVVGGGRRRAARRGAAERRGRAGAVPRRLLRLQVRAGGARHGRGDAAGRRRGPRAGGALPGRAAAGRRRRSGWRRSGATAPSRCAPSASRGASGSTFRGGSRRTTRSRWSRGRRGPCGCDRSTVTGRCSGAAA